MKMLKQNELDLIKWFKSEETGVDACGSFEFCVKCDKTLENPCEKAYAKQYKKPTAKKVEKKVEVKPEPKAEAKIPVAKKPAKKSK